eukprot:Anaeramoba_ignava/c20095_g1_i1.p1 GENE.c20095_g1_i1~~c20095_g1_i1.p1  ORF type:complete len:520 (+),score=143.46 c20095_g1_i1:424-1983(+)
MLKKHKEAIYTKDNDDETPFDNLEKNKKKEIEEIIKQEENKSKDKKKDSGSVSTFSDSNSGKENEPDKQKAPNDPNQEFSPQYYQEAEFVSPYNNPFLVFVDKYFNISKRNSNFTTEILAGITLFLTTSYILQKQTTILGIAGMDSQSVFTATALTTGLGTITIGLVSGFPMLISTGMGENFFFVDTICHTLGYDWKIGLSLVFFHGIISVILSIVIPKSNLIYAIPSTFRIGIAYGIGLLIGKIGIIDMLLLDTSSHFDPKYQALIGGLTLVLIVYGASRNHKLVVVLGVIGSVVLSIIISIARKDLSFPKWVTPSLKETAFKLKFDYRNAVPIYYVIVYVLNTLFDVVCSSLTIIQLTFLSKIKYDNESFVKLVAGAKNNRFMKILLVNSAFVIVSSLLGTSPTVIFIESCVAAALGARTGLCSIVAGLLFIISIFFYPIMMIIPQESIGPLLVWTTISVLQMVEYMNFDDINEMIPVAISSVLIPLLDSVIYGVSSGYIVLLLVWITGKKQKMEAN